MPDLRAAGCGPGMGLYVHSVYIRGAKVQFVKPEPKVFLWGAVSAEVNHWLLFLHVAQFDIFILSIHCSFDSDSEREPQR